jgi:hypothetical protein
VGFASVMGPPCVRGFFVRQASKVLERPAPCKSVTSSRVDLARARGRVIDWNFGAWTFRGTPIATVIADVPAFQRHATRASAERGSGFWLC